MHSCVVKRGNRTHLADIFAGSGGPKDEEEARRLLGLAAAQGVADAQCALAGMFYEGRGGPKDEVEARRLCGLAAAQRHAGAQSGLAGMLIAGLGGPKDEA